MSTNREKIYFSEENDPSTFEYDEKLPSLPLPRLEDTLERYFESLKPFGNASELECAKKVIKEFETGIGKDLHSELVKKAARERNWVERWWEDLAYHWSKLPLYPYAVMGMPLGMESVGVPETAEYSLKAAARCLYHILECWDLLRREKLKPVASADGKIRYSWDLYKRFFSTSRIPGVEKDRLESHFRTIREGESPSHYLITAKGRIFLGESLNPNGSLLTPQQLLATLEAIRATVDCDENLGDCVPILTCDNRSQWAENRKYLCEISQHNKDLLKLVESSLLVLILDDNEPANYSESTALALAGDFHSKWADRCSVMVLFKNGKISFVGEHSAYDGTISVSFAFFVLISLLEVSEPDWSLKPTSVSLPSEKQFTLDDNLRREIERVKHECDERKDDVVVCYSKFDGFGKDFLKENRLHPDAFVQMVLQLTYFRIHQSFASTYETALMRQYYHGRTETLRSCTVDFAKFVETFENSNESNGKKLTSLRTAIETHLKRMNEARSGNGIDRHLFGLWCLAYEKGLDPPQFYSEPLYIRSGGGGNFVLSTSTLGFTPIVGMVAPMVMDGYGVFYSITSESIYLLISAYRASQITNAHKFERTITESFDDVMKLVCAGEAKL